MAGKKQAVGVIGLGVIGSRVAANLRRAGFEVWVYNRSPKAEPNFLSSAVEVAETADVLQLFVSDGPALLETMRTLAPVLTARHLVMNHATVSPDDVKAAAAIAAEASAGFLDVPFTGSLEAAQAGELVYYIGGSKELIERARPVLASSSKSILEMGEVGQAMIVKLAGNLAAAVAVEAFAEALALVESNGVAPEKFLEAIAQHGVRSKLGDMKLPGMVSGNFDTHFALKHMFKDAQLALEVARAAGVELPATSAAAGALMAGIQKGWGDLDFSAVARHYAFPERQPVGEEALKVLQEAPASGAAPAKKKFKIFG